MVGRFKKVGGRVRETIERGQISSASPLSYCARSHPANLSNSRTRHASKLTLLVLKGHTNVSVSPGWILSASGTDLVVGGVVLRLGHCG